MRTKRVAGSALLIPFLVGGSIANSIALGASALVIGDQNIKTLSSRIEQDIEHLGNSIGQLEKQVDSLAEMVIQNCRGMDLIFLKGESLHGPR